MRALFRLPSDQADVLPDVVMPPCSFGRRLAGGPFFAGVSRTAGSGIFSYGAVHSLRDPDDPRQPRHFFDRQHLRLEIRSKGRDLDALRGAAQQSSGNDRSSFGP